MTIWPLSAEREELNTKFSTCSYTCSYRYRHADLKPTNNYISFSHNLSLSVIVSAMPEKGSNSDTDSNGNDTASTLVNGDSEQFPLDTLLEKMPKSPTSPRQIRRLSVPDMHRLKRAVEQRETIGDAEIPYGKLQVCLFFFFYSIGFLVANAVQLRLTC